MAQWNSARRQAGDPRTTSMTRWCIFSYTRGTETMMVGRHSPRSSASRGTPRAIQVDAPAIMPAKTPLMRSKTCE